MPDVLSFCVCGCCHFVNNRRTTRSGYALAARAHQWGINSTEPVEAVIPCRKVAGGLQYSIESTLGFYLGLRLPRATGISVRQDENLLLFDRATGDFLRVATDEDLLRWNVAHRQLSRIVRNVLDRTPSLLQIPLGGPKG
jgi:hypothetical protein